MLILNTRKAGNVRPQRHRGRQRNGATKIFGGAGGPRSSPHAHDRQRAAARGLVGHACGVCPTRSAGCGTLVGGHRRAGDRQARRPQAAGRRRAPGSTFSGPPRARALRLVLARREAHLQARQLPQPDRGDRGGWRRRCKTATRPRGRRARWPAPEIHANAIDTLLRGRAAARHGLDRRPAGSRSR